MKFCLHLSYSVHNFDVDFLFQSLIELLIRVSTLMAVGLLTYKFYVTKLWDYGLSELHLRRSVETSLDSCVTPWGDVPLVSAFAAEFIGTCFLVSDIFPDLTREIEGYYDSIVQKYSNFSSK